MNSLGSTVTKGADCRRDVKYSTDMEKAALCKNSKLDLSLRKKHINCYCWCVAVCGAAIGRVGRVERESFEMWCWRGMCGAEIGRVGRVDRQSFEMLCW
jgi:hypothetical protein